MYRLTITATRDLSQASRDFVVDLATYVKLFIEGSHAALHHIAKKRLR
jgi:hypothetical protein